MSREIPQLRNFEAHMVWPQVGGRGASKLYTASTSTHNGGRLNAEWSKGGLRNDIYALTYARRLLHRDGATPSVQRRLGAHRGRRMNAQINKHMLQSDSWQNPGISVLRTRHLSTRCCWYFWDCMLDSTCSSIGSSSKCSISAIS